MSDLGFTQLLAQHHAELKKNYDDAEEFGADWTPPDSPKDDPYLCVGTKCLQGTFDKNGQKVFFWKPYVKIIAPQKPEIHDKEFPLGFFNTGAPGAMKGQARALNNGGAVPFEEINGVFTGIPNMVMKVDVVTSTSKKNGLDYTNCYVREVLATEVVENAQETPPRG